MAVAVAVCRWLRLERGHDRASPLQRHVDYNVQKDGSIPITFGGSRMYYNVRALARRWHVVPFSYQTTGVR